MANTNDIYEPDIDEVIKSEQSEKGYIASRREKIADEFKKISPDEKQHWYANLLSRKDRPLVGMAFSGGGIRSATFNLGLVQALSKFGILPWVDYLSSVSGGGYIASCMNSLLAYEEKKLDLNEKESNPKRYYPFSPHWKRFPFNPDLQVFDTTGVAYKLPVFNENTLKPQLETQDKKSAKIFNALQTGLADEINLDLKEVDDKNRNRQLEHLRNLGNYLIPRMGPFTFDTMRGVVGAFLLRIGYTFWMYFLVMFLIAASHFALTYSFTPEIIKDFPLDKTTLTTAPPASDGTSPDAAVPADKTLPITKMLALSFIKYEGGATSIPWMKYLTVLVYGWLYALIMVTLISFCYRKDITTDNRLMDWKSPNEHISLYSYLVIKGIRWTFFGLAIILLPVLSGWISFMELSISPLSHEQFNLAIATCVLSVLFLSLSLYLFIKSGDETWAQQGLADNEFIDRQVVYSFTLITSWTMSLILSALRYSSLAESGELNLYWLWMPAIFILGGMAGSATLQATQILQNLFPLRLIFSKHVVSKVNEKYDHNSVGVFQRWLLKLIGIPDNHELKDDSKLIRKSRGVDYTFKIWASPEFRSIFWTLQGLLFYGLLGSIALSLIALPNYFSIPSSSEPATKISLSVALLSALWAYLTSSGKNIKIGEWISKVFKLPEELYQILLALLVLALNFSVFYLIESMLMDRLLTSLSFLQMVVIILSVIILFAVTGYFVNANYLSAHYFYRDRLGEAYFQTSVSDNQSGKIRVVRDDRNRPMSRTLKPQCSAPYHIVMTSLNMSGSWHLEYKDRKSRPFIFTRDYCGSDITGYVKTVNYRNDNTKYSQAIALSGAAVSSGIGHLTFFAQAFLVTLFNLRLGAWLTNPKLYENPKDAEKAKNSEESNFWGYYLWNEVRGQMSEREKLVNITDGAHTGDNIGLYPLFQRRCKYIIAGDAGEDPRGTFNELFSVLRQVEVDFGIKVDINLNGVGPDEYDEDKKVASKSKRHFAIGKIHYPATTTEDPVDGWLIYFHPSIADGDPEAILKYWERHKSDFPHPTTADQFFDDEQFEVMRILGEWTVQSAIEEVADKYKTDKLIRTFIKPKDKDEPFTVPAKVKKDVDKLEFQKVLLNGLPNLLEKYYYSQYQQS